MKRNNTFSTFFLIVDAVKSNVRDNFEDALNALVKKINDKPKAPAKFEEEPMFFDTYSCHKKALFLKVVEKSGDGFNR